MKLEEAIAMFLDGSITASQIEEKINNNTIVFDVKNDYEYANLTKELNKLYSSITNKPVMLPLNSGRKQNFINLLNAIENKTDITKYYSSNDFNRL